MPSPTPRHLPLELDLAILRLALPPPSYAAWAERAAFLSGAALVCSAWTAWAQVEMVRDVVLPGVKQLDGLLERLERGEVPRPGRVRSVRLGGRRGAEWAGVDGKVGRLVGMCEGVEEVYLSGLEHHAVDVRTLAKAKGLRRLFASDTLLTHSPSPTSRPPSFPHLAQLSLSHLPPSSPAQTHLLATPSLTSLAIDRLSPADATLLSAPGAPQIRHLLQTSFSHTPVLPHLVLQGWSRDGAVWSSSSSSSSAAPAAHVRVAWLKELAWYPGQDLADYILRHPALEEVWFPAPHVWASDDGGKEDSACTLADLLALCRLRRIQVRQAAAAQPPCDPSRRADDDFSPRFWELVGHDNQRDPCA